jgi:hypothetical protein
VELKMENANKIQHWNNSLVRTMANVRPTLIVGIVLTVMLAGLTGFNPFLGIACALLLFLLVLVVPKPILIVYGLILFMPLTGGLARGNVVPFLRIGQAILVLGFILFLLARPSPQGKSRLTAIDLAFALYFLTEAVFPMLALYYRGEQVNLNYVGSSGQSPLQTLLGPLQYYLLYRIVVATISTERQIKVVLELSFIASIIVSVIGIVERFVAPVRTFIQTYYPPSVQSATVSLDELRITSTLGHYSGLAAYLVFTIILVLACYTVGERMKISPLLLAITAAFDSIALLLTGTFSGWIGLAVGVTTFFILTGRVPKLFILIPCGIALAALIFQSFLSARLDQQLGAGAAVGLLPQSLAFRINLWESLFLPAIGQHRLFGAGPSPAVLNSWPAEESQYLLLLLRGGLPYFFSYLFLIGVAITMCWRQMKSKGRDAKHSVAFALLVILITMSVMNVSAEYFTYVGGTQVLWTLLAILVASRQFQASSSLTAVEQTLKRFEV